MMLSNAWILKYLWGMYGLGFIFCEIKANRPQLLGHALPLGDVFSVTH